MIVGFIQDCKRRSLRQCKGDHYQTSVSLMSPTFESSAVCAKVWAYLNHTDINSQFCDPFFSAIFILTPPIQYSRKCADI